MKAFRGTAILGVLVTALALYTAWEYKKAQDAIGNSPDEKKLFTFKSEDIDKIKITHPDQTLALEKVNGQWQLKEPVSDEAEDSAVEALLYSIVIQKGKPFRTEDEAKSGNLADFGLDKPGSVVEVSAKGKTETISVSAKNAFDGSFYVSQGSDLFLGDRGLAQVVTRDVKALRSRHIWREDEADIDRVEVEVSADKIKDKFTVKKNADTWEVDPKPEFAVDSERVKEWLGRLQMATAVEFVVDNPTPEMKKNYLLVKPSLSVHAHFKRKDGGEGEWTLTAGQDRAEDVFVMSSVRNAIYKFSRKGLKDVRVTREYFRDGRAPFKFPIEQASEIELRHAGSDHKFKKDGSDWKLEGDNKGLSFDPDQLVSLIHSITNIEAKEFVPAKDVKGFKDSEAITVRGSDGATLFQMSWGDEYKGKKSFNEEMPLASVKTNRTSEAMGVDALKFKGLFNSKLVVKKESSH